MTTKVLDFLKIQFLICNPENLNNTQRSLFIQPKQRVYRASDVAGVRTDDLGAIFKMSA